MTTSSVALKEEEGSHSLLMGYLLWTFGFTGSHRFYFGKPITGTIWFCTAGLLGIGWLIDLFLIPSMDRKAEQRFESGKYDYNIAWVLLTFLGAFGVHRFYLGKFATGLLWALTGGFFLMGWVYDYWTLNSQIAQLNRTAA
jgi:TM2 domain-containing membrane protein YozV